MATESIPPPVCHPSGGSIGSIDHLRKPKASTHLFDEKLHDAPANLRRIPGAALFQVVAKAVEMLPARERTRIDLLFRKNLPAHDAAAILHLSVGAVYTQKSRILAKLRKIVREFDSL